MTQSLTTTNGQNEIMERVLMAGDLGKLTAEQRMSYYMRTCESLGLNPMTRPFEYITLNGKLTLYARKDCTDQLRSLRGVSIGKPDIQFQDTLIIVSVEARDASGRTDSDIGVVNKSDMRGDLSNVLMKAVTKAKRRVTLSICGLGMLDETEVESIPDAKPFAEPAPVTPAISQPYTAEERATASAVLTWLDANPIASLTPDKHGAYIKQAAAEIGCDLTGLGLKGAWDKLHKCALSIVQSPNLDAIEPVEYAEAAK